MKTQPAEWQLRLYIAGQTPKSIMALANIKKYTEEHLKGKYSIEIIDLLLPPPNLPKATKFWLCQPWYENFLSLFVKKLATCLIPVKF